jgi:Flp pilus assembly protein TadG
LKLEQKRSFWRNEFGGATIEFVALALPLFLPVIFFLHQFATVSAEEGLARTLAREGARAFVASTDQNSAEAAMNSVIAAAGRELGLTDRDFSRMAVGLECSASPCFTPNGKITVTIHFGATKEFPAVTSSAQEYISPWV